MRVVSGFTVIFPLPVTLIVLIIVLLCFVICFVYEFSVAGGKRKVVAWEATSGNMNKTKNSGR